MGLGSEVDLGLMARTCDAGNWKPEINLCFPLSEPLVAVLPGNAGRAPNTHQGTVCLREHIPLIFGGVLHPTDSNILIPVHQPHSVLSVSSPLLFKNETTVTHI